VGMGTTSAAPKLGMKVTISPSTMIRSDMGQWLS
jgi:hypothetical protein